MAASADDPVVICTLFPLTLTPKWGEVEKTGWNISTLAALTGHLQEPERRVADALRRSKVQELNVAREQRAVRASQSQEASRL